MVVCLIAFQVPVTKSLAAAVATSQILSACAKFANDIVQSDNHHDHFGSVFLEPTIAALRAGIEKQPSPQLLDIFKFLDRGYGSDRERAFLDLLNGFTQSVVSPLVAALRRGEASFRTPNAPEGSPSVNCHGLLIGVVELVNQHQGACGDAIYATSSFETAFSLAVTTLGHFARDARLAMLVCSFLNQAAYKLRSTTDVPTRDVSGTTQPYPRVQCVILDCLVHV